MRTLLLPTLLATMIGLNSICFGQDRPKAILIDELERTNCEILMGRLDSFFLDLQQKANYRGYAVIKGDASNMRTNLVYEGMIRAYTNFRKFDQSRLSIVRGKLGNKFKIEFWQIPTGVDHKFETADWSLIVPKPTKPFRFYDTTGEFEGCPGASSTTYFAEYLLANPGSKGNIVIRGKSPKIIEREESEVLNDLVENSKIPRKRLKIFRILDRNTGWDWATSEYWFVP